MLPIGSPKGIEARDFIPIGPPKGIEVRDLYIKISILIDFSRFWIDFIENNMILYGN